MKKTILISFLIILLFTYNSYADSLNISGCSVSYFGYLKRLALEYEKKI